MSFERKVYLESLQVLSEIDEQEEWMREALETSPATAGGGGAYSSSSSIGSPLMSRKIRWTPHVATETMTDTTFDGFYRDNHETVLRIYASTDRSSFNHDDDDDYCTPFQNLPEYKAYQCVRTLRKRRRSFCMILLVAVCFMWVIVPKVLTNVTDATTTTTTTITSIRPGESIEMTIDAHRVQSKLPSSQLPVGENNHEEHGNDTRTPTGTNITSVVTYNATDQLEGTPVT
jgi:hypothetical protein